MAIINYQLRINGPGVTNHIITTGIPALNGEGRHEYEVTNPPVALQPGEDYDVEYRAQDGGGNYSEWSDPETVTLDPFIGPELLDNVDSDVWAAYSVNFLKTGYSGAAIRVKDANGVEEDIGFDEDGELDTAALSGDAPYKVIKLYDQSGNARHIDAMDDDHAPTLGVVNKEIEFYTGGLYAKVFELPSMASLTAGEIFLRRRIIAPSTAGVGGWWVTGTGAPSHMPYSDGNFYDGFGSDTRKGPFSNSATLTDYHIVNVHSAAGDWGFKIGSTVLNSTSSNTVAFPSAPLLGVSIADLTTYAEGHMTGMVIFSEKVTEDDRSYVLANL